MPWGVGRWLKWLAQIKRLERLWHGKLFRSFYWFSLSRNGHMWPPFGQCMFSSANTLRLKWLARCWSSRFGWKGGTIRNAVKWKVEASKRQNLTIQTNNQICNQIQREFSEMSWLWTKVVAACCSHAWILKNFVILYINFNLTYHIIIMSYDVVDWCWLWFHLEVCPVSSDRLTLQMGHGSLGLASGLRGTGAIAPLVSSRGAPNLDGETVKPTFPLLVIMIITDNYVKLEVE